MSSSGSSPSGRRPSGQRPSSGQRPGADRPAQPSTRRGDSSIQWIWPFKFLSKLGEGGMGVVYKAENLTNNELVAVKLLPPDLERDIIRERFKREIEILSKLRHPNVVHCYEGKTETDRDYYAMELVEGGSIEELIRDRGRLFWGEVVKLGIAMCAGLAHAHKQDVIHRDIKPGNFLLTKDGVPKLADFGLAMVAAGSKLTQTGKTMGTLRYMAPEQVRGKDMTPQTDLYALGVVFFEMLTGKQPFTGDSPAKIMQAHLSTPAADVRSLAADVPAELAEIVADLLKKDPDDRPRTATEVARRLGNVSAIKVVEPTPEVMTGKPAKPKRSRPVVRATSGPAWVVPALLLAVLVLALLAINLTRRLPARDAAVDAYRALLAAKSSPIRLEALRRSGALAAVDEDYAAELASRLESKNPQERAAAAEALADAGSNGKAYLGELLTLQKSDTESYVRIAAGRSRDALLKVSDHSGGLTPYLLVVALVLGLTLYLARRGVVLLPGPLGIWFGPRAAVGESSDPDTPSA